MSRRTKIVTTLGPATDRDNNLEKIIAAGANMVRLNFSHGEAADHIKRAEQVREIAARLSIEIAIMGDLQGPKIRISTFQYGKIKLVVGDTFTLDSDLQNNQGDQHSVGLDYKTLPQEVSTGDILLLDDGRVQLQVASVEGNKVHTTVTIGGTLSDNKGINKQGGGLSAGALTEKDKKDIITAAKIGCDYLAVSFPRSGADLHYARKLAADAGCIAKIVAKIERAEAVESDVALGDVILASDAVMVARGDLGVEVGDARLAGIQKNIIRTARHFNRVVITATQMMESMIHSPMPTRAEVLDVANAVLDGTDAVMLSAETASGDFPVETVKSMAEVCLGAEKYPSINVSTHRMDETFANSEEALAMMAMFAANHTKGIKAIVTITASGTTPLLMSRISSGLPIYALSYNQHTLNYCALYRGVTPFKFDGRDKSNISFVHHAIGVLKAQNFVQEGDLVIMTHGDYYQAGSTDTCKILNV
ncbi:pyruvate kinase [Psychromonas sp.]|uniref:pyruvate kinase n=1 Tax=Psychromonas sp. TaxID=1884585 RepID=UPI003564FA8F